MDNMGQVPSLAEQAYLRLRQDILVCVLAPGQVVTERELAGQYEMSKTPIREALTQVCHDGLVQRLPGRGYMVAPITVKDLRDLFDMRLILEVAAAERAASQPSPTLIAELRRLSALSYNPTDTESHIQFLRGNRVFHLTLADAAGNRRLTCTLENLLLELDRYFHLGLRLRDSSAEMRREHKEVVAALEMGDVEALKGCMEQQVVTSRNRILEAIVGGDLPSVQLGG
jgi:DNA-binding GntR family transcriptional regulator